MSHTVVGLFNNKNAAQAAKQELIQKGFTAENIDFHIEQQPKVPITLIRRAR